MNFVGKIRCFVADNTGATAIEYGLIAAGIALVVLAVIGNVGTHLKTVFSTLAASL